MCDKSRLYVYYMCITCSGHANRIVQYGSSCTIRHKIAHNEHFLNSHTSKLNCWFEYTTLNQFCHLSNQINVEYITMDTVEPQTISLEVIIYVLP